MKYLFAKLMIYAVLLLLPLDGHSHESGVRIFTEISPPAAMYLSNGSLGGFGVDIVRALQKEIGDETAIEVVPWARGYKFLNEKPGVALMPTTRTPDREALFQWVGPLMTINWTMYGLSGSDLNIENLDDARSAAGIGVYREDIRARFLKESGFTNLQTVESQDINLKKLLRHRIALIVSSDIGMKAYYDRDKNLRGKIKPVLSFRTVDLYLAFSKDTNPKIVEKWNNAYEKLARTGVISEIQGRWK